MVTMRKFKIGVDECGLLFSGGEFQVLLDPGRHWFFDPMWKITVERISLREPAFKHRDLGAIAKSGALKDCATVVDLKDGERGLLWIDGSFDSVLAPGVHAFWNAFHDVRVEIVEDSELRNARELCAEKTNAKVLLGDTVERVERGVKVP